MNRLPLIFCLFILFTVGPAEAGIYKCVIDGKTVFTAAATAPEGCESHEVKAVPYDPKEAARAQERLRQMDANDQAFKAEQERRLKERQQQQTKRAADERAKLRANVERQVREWQFPKAAGDGQSSPQPR